MANLQLGQQIPDFSLLNQANTPVALKDFRGKWLVVYFYPKASTPGCTTQACGMRDSQTQLLADKVAVVGISPDPVKRLQKFYDAQGLNFDLLSDEDHQIAELFGVWTLKKFMGKEFMGVVRTTFILNPKGELVKILDTFKTSDHHEKVIEALNTLL